MLVLYTAIGRYHTKAGVTSIISLSYHPVGNPLDDTRQDETRTGSTHQNFNDGSFGAARWNRVAYDRPPIAVTDVHRASLWCRPAPL